MVKGGWTREPDSLREVIDDLSFDMNTCTEGPAEDGQGCDPMHGLCDTCCLRYDYRTVLLTLVELLDAAVVEAEGGES